MYGKISVSEGREKHLEMSGKRELQMNKEMDSCLELKRTSTEVKERKV